jgi:rhodanese-related sulfurtransferase
MGILSETLALAQERARAANLPYAGALTPREAWEVLQATGGAARLVDVRTRAEWDWVGRVPGAVEIEWLTYPGNEPNPHFLAQLQRQVDPETLVMFLCRSGARSNAAATLANRSGYTNAYNILEGFEGDKDAHGHRSKVGGWRFAGLPWTQG